MTFEHGRLERAALAQRNTANAVAKVAGTDVEQQFKITDLPEGVRQNLYVIAPTQWEWERYAKDFGFNPTTYQSRVQKAVSQPSQIAKRGIFILFLGMPADLDLMYGIIGAFKEWEQTWIDTGGRIFFPNGRPGNL